MNTNSDLDKVTNIQILETLLRIFLKSVTEKGIFLSLKCMEFYKNCIKRMPKVIRAFERKKKDNHITCINHEKAANIVSVMAN